MALNDLYGDSHTVQLAKGGKDDFDHSKFDNAAQHVYTHGGFNAHMMSDEDVRALTHETYRVLSSAIGVKQEVPDDLRRLLEESTFVFSGFKTYHELREVSALIQAEDGGFKSWDIFSQEVLAIDNRYNRNYLQAEYNFAVQSAQMATKWKDFEKDGDEYLLQYRTAGDDKVRAEHAVLHNTTLPINDPFWDEYLPPLDWGCRCTTVQVLREKYPVSDSAEAIAAGERATDTPKKEIFRFNPGKTGNLFPPKHPYFKLTRQDKPVVKEAIEAQAAEELEQNEKLKEVIEELKQNPAISYLDPQRLDAGTTEEQIISRLAGRDKTRGSCSSLAFAYAGNKGGINVLDFRDGESRSFFSQDYHISQIVTAAGGMVVKEYNDFVGANQVLKTVEAGKEYYFACGRHAAIVRKNGEAYEYLELQHDTLRGWHGLTKEVLQHRFGAQRSHTVYGHKMECSTFLIEIDQLNACSDFREMLGYINTQADKQQKGDGGSVK